MEIWLRDKDSHNSDYISSSYPYEPLRVYSNENSRLEVLEAATCRSHVWWWKNTWRDLEEVKNWPQQMPPLLPSPWKRSELSLGGNRFPKTLIEEMQIKSIFWTWTQISWLFEFCLIVTCAALQAGRASNVWHILHSIGQLTTTFRGVTTFEEGEASLACSFQFKPAQHAYATDQVALRLLWGLESWAVDAWAFSLYK